MSTIAWTPQKRYHQLLLVGSAWRVIQCLNSRCITKSTKRQWKLLVGRVKWDACATLLIEVLMHYQWDLSAFELHRGAFYLLLLLATCGISQQSNGSPNNTGAQTRHIWYSCSNLKLVQTCCHELRHCTHSHLIHLPNLSCTLTR